MTSTASPSRANPGASVNPNDDVRTSPLILGLGGTTRPGSSSERALRLALGEARALGATTEILSAVDLALPHYAPGQHELTPQARRMLDLIIQCDGLMIATPGFHGGPSGLLKNALDYTEELRDEPRPYLEGRAVGCIVCAAGWQATATTLAAVRSTVHALRGWPTPLGVTINSSASSDAAPDPISAAAPQLALLAYQVVSFARWQAGIGSTR
ncbi:NAD(P)H-dependent oxidoreductase [Conexibacter stalactiti]|uniref:NAD(P)H-dependent oxidoreductase n=1 Tax=Conexibacter stalactiti TaxID=1940611 RepID=A0ABU4HII9_9ACTN|nr:NAD(P)H-dependent oxidoreductase [Conexibacter stalactiti]MDW5593082.1 NAD(P)H-dependent oxidoreductase [Conexibacter stalactiti]MEC5033723.1 NAD(P)H-dependent oxidoreductase [Conexibacter stalactiti]